MKKFGISQIAFLILLFSTPCFGQMPTEHKILPKDGATDNAFGSSVSKYGTWAAAGSIFANSGEGAVYLFKKAGNGDWGQAQKINPPQSTAFFGSSVSITSQHLAVSAGKNATFPNGVVFIYKRTDFTWSLVGTLTPAANSSATFFGQRVKMHGGRLMVSDPSDQHGRVYFYRPLATPNLHWVLENSVTPPSSSNSNLVHFGRDIDMKGNFAIVGAPGDSQNKQDSGAAYVYQYQGINQNWVLLQKLKASDPDEGDIFGSSVAVSFTGDLVAVGARNDDDNGTHAGSVYLFKKSSGNSWNQTKKILASDGSANDNFGSDVDLRSGHVLVGAGNKNIGTLTAAGGAYLYTDLNNAQATETIIKASDASANDLTASEVVIDFGPEWILSSSGNDQLAPEAGAAYIFSNPPGLEKPHFELNPWPYFYIYTGDPILEMNKRAEIVLQQPQKFRIGFKVIEPPAHGTVKINSRNSSILYAPERGFTGEDPFTILMEDQYGHQNTMLMNVFVQEKAAAGTSKRKFEMKKLEKRKFLKRK